jgi:hypothetical protein
MQPDGGNQSTIYKAAETSEWVHLRIWCLLLERRMSRMKERYYELGGGVFVRHQYPQGLATKVVVAVNATSQIQVQLLADTK